MFKMVNKKKRSYGILLAKYSKKVKELKLIMVEKKYSYGFFDLIYGNYNIQDRGMIQEMFYDMTDNEKKAIINLPFENLWNYIFDDPDPYQNSRFYTKLINFNELKKKYNIKEFINNEHSLLMWEFPKGRSEKSENGINAAIRELKEETSISFNQYKLLGKKIEFDIKDCNNLYPVTYYLAVYNDNDEDLNLNLIDKREISDVKWQRISHTNILKGGKIMKKILSCSIPIFRKYFNEM